MRLKNLRPFFTCCLLENEVRLEERIKDQGSRSEFSLADQDQDQDLDSIIELLWVKLVNLHQLLDENTEVWGRWR